MAPPATIKIFLAKGNPRQLRIAELSNWSGIGVAAPRSEIDEFLERPELHKPGIYILTGQDPETGESAAYVGEAEVLRSRITSHKKKDFWVHAYVFLSKDENLTKGHIRYLEGRILEEVKAAGRAVVLNYQGSGSPLPEADQAEMEVFLGKIRQLLPALGSDVLTPSPSEQAAQTTTKHLICEIKGLTATGARTPDGFLVFADSQAVLETRPSSLGTGNFAERRRGELVEKGILIPENGYLRFTQDVEFSSPSGAATVVRGGNSNGLTNWKTPDGRTLKELENGLTTNTAPEGAAEI